MKKDEGWSIFLLVYAIVLSLNFGVLDGLEKPLARQGTESILSPKQQRRPLPFLLYLSFFYAWNNQPDDCLCFSLCSPSSFTTHTHTHPHTPTHPHTHPHTPTHTHTHTPTHSPCIVSTLL